MESAGSIVRKVGKCKEAGVSNLGATEKKRCSEMTEFDIVCTATSSVAITPVSSVAVEQIARLPKLSRIHSCKDNQRPPIWFLGMGRIQESERLIAIV